MEPAPFVSESVSASSELAEVFCRLWNNVIVELEDDTTSGLLVDGDIELCLSDRRYEQPGRVRSSGISTYEDVRHFVSTVWWEMERSEKFSE